MHNASCHKINPDRQPEINPSVTKPGFSAPPIRQDTTPTLNFIRKVCHWRCMLRVAGRTGGCRLDISTGIPLFCFGWDRFRSSGLVAHPPATMFDVRMASFIWNIHTRVGYRSAWQLSHHSHIVIVPPAYSVSSCCFCDVQIIAVYTENHNSKFWKCRA